MNNVHVTLIKAFTKDPDKGNPAVVIAGPVDSQESFKAVQQAPCGVAAIIDTRVKDKIPIRFFYEHGKTETFACGHATLAAAYLAFPAQSNQVTGNFVNTKGLVINVVCSPDGRISQTQPTPEFKNFVGSKKYVADALGISPNEILDNLPTQLVGAPDKMKLKIPVQLKTLLAIQRNFTTIREFCNHHSRTETAITGLVPFALDVEGCDIHARHFPNRDEEDLVCGVGSVALAKYLQARLKPDQTNFNFRWGPGKEGAGNAIVRINAGSKISLEGYAVLSGN